MKNVNFQAIDVMTDAGTWKNISTHGVNADKAIKNARENARSYGHATRVVAWNEDGTRTLVASIGYQPQAGGRFVTRVNRTYEGSPIND